MDSRPFLILQRPECENFIDAKLQIKTFQIMADRKPPWASSSPILFCSARCPALNLNQITTTSTKLETAGRDMIFF